MKEAVVSKDLKVIIQDVDFPTIPSPDHLIIKVSVSGSNPKDWAMAERCGCSIALLLPELNPRLTDSLCSPWLQSRR